MPRNVHTTTWLYSAHTLAKWGLEFSKDPHDPENQDGVITHLEPDILESGQVGLRKHH